MKIQSNRLDLLFKAHQAEYEAAALRVLRSGGYIMGQEGEAFEEEFKNFAGTSYCVGLNSGLDALILALKALDIKPSDEVIVPANTYVATVLSITEVGATPIFVEPDNYHNIDVSKIEEAITAKTKVIMPVHLFGQAANMDKINSIANKYNLYTVEDCAQSHSARYNGKMTGTTCDIGCFSFFPTKNLGAFGDSGAIITNNKEYAQKIRILRNYGSEKKYHFLYKGMNSRLDEMQAALLRTRLPYLNDIIEERRKIAMAYLCRMTNEKIVFPKVAPFAEHIWHLFVVECETRSLLEGHLEKLGISFQVHYPIPPHLSKCYEYLGYRRGDFPITEKYAETILSLPLYNGMTEDEVQYVIDAINSYK